jgi:competence protein ComEC
MNALLTGDKSLLEFEDKQLFSLTGTAHVLAVSGLHVGLIALIIYAFIGFIPNKWIKFAIFSLIVVAYVIITGSQPSAARAAVMAIIFLFLKNVSRDTTLLNVTSFCGIIMIVLSPELLYSAGFQMSLGSVIGIALLYNPINSFFIRIFNIKAESVNWMIGSLSISLAAGIAVSPFVAYYFGVYSIISPLTNLFAVPFTSLALIFGLIAVMISYVVPGVGIIYAYAASSFIDLTVWLNKLALMIPFSYIEGDNITWIVVLISAALAYIFVSKDIKQTLFRFGFGIILILIFSINRGEEKNQGTSLLVRNQYFGILNESNDRVNLLIADRKPEFFRYKDFSLIKQLKKTQKPLYIYSCGLIGANIHKELESSEIINIDFRTLNEAVRIYGLKNIQQEIRIHHK